MARRPLTDNEKAAVLAGLAGILMLASGVTGASQWRHTFALIGELVGPSPALRFVGYVFVALGSVGGIFVLMGAYAFREDHVRTGKLLIYFGTGFTVLSLFLFLALVVRSGELPFAGASILGFVGIALSLIARFRAKRVPDEPVATPPPPAEKKVL
ncbi:MAG TPA: hypothetical protein VGR51_10975 [Thermoplasmata archaeon]|jgi:hypothetical protein|nr:hypothetical protein [Thermoplasmata archaeon]